MAPVPVARAFRISMVLAVIALALPGCMRRSGPVAAAPPPSDLDSLAYGAPRAPAPVVLANSGGALSALRAGLASRRVVAGPAVYAAPMPMPVTVAYDAAYKLDAGDRLRIVIYGQEGLTNTYYIDAGGSITVPLIASVPARGRTPAGLAAEITARLRNGYIRDPSVAVEIEAYRPFFILCEVAAPGQYPYGPNMSGESAVAIAGGFSPRARRYRVTVTHTDGGGSVRAVVPLGTPINPGDTVLVGERWF